ncbi:baseplate assembly protein [Aliiroseovarius zhejiangensis]|uniref:Baseplate assembly protein n=1 Tax=Aliiroseovarius zhejiangensis TaxID=1632025 RepID=A0ABQ3IMW4_9RHOB|nr:baseplate J/gp47 family protein [Aliiroseovarius zhejiangensis]GHE88273.1 baseplate assembly protein [Aliiroseovarius zhejiangensis]
MSAFTAINLDKLPAPLFIEQPSFTEIFEARKARLLELAEEKGGIDLADSLRPTLELESEPIVLLLQEDSYRELILRAAIQDASKSRLLAFAKGAVLDHIAAEYGVARQTIQEADPHANPPLELIMEGDERLRQRVQLAPEAFTTGGTIGDYTFNALAASPLVADVAISDSSASGVVDVTILSTEGNGVPDAGLLTTVSDYLSNPDRRRLCDTVNVNAATVVTFAVDATLTFYEGPDASVVMAQAQAALEAYLAKNRKLGHDITRSGIFAALHQEGVQNVTLTAPATDVVIAWNEVSSSTGITLTNGGTDV